MKPDNQASSHTVVVVSGLMCSGKSELMRKIRALQQFRDALYVSMDQVQKKYWGENYVGNLTKSERVFRNELTRLEVKVALVVKKESIVLVEAPMLTRDDHQKPMVEMIASAQRYLCSITSESAGSDKSSCPSIDLRVILMHCDADTISRRMFGRRLQADPDINQDATKMQDFLNAARQFEFPLPGTYTPLILDSSSELLEDEQVRLDEAIKFIGGSPLDPEVVAMRLHQSKIHLKKAIKIASPHP